MFRSQQGFLQVAALAAVTASCLAAAACGGSATDPLANMSGAKIQTEAVVNADAAPSLTLHGTEFAGTTKTTYSLGIKHGKGCAGTIGTSAGNMNVVVLGDTAYAKPGNPPQGKYLAGASVDAGYGGVGGICNMSRFTGMAFSPGSDVTKGALTTLNGIRVLPLTGHGGLGQLTMYVTDANKPQLVEWTTSGNREGATYSFSVGAPVTLTAPPSSQVKTVDIGDD